MTILSMPVRLKTPTERRSRLQVAQTESHVSYNHCPLKHIYSTYNTSSPLANTISPSLPPSLSFSFAAVPPKSPPPFCRPFSGVMKLTSCPVLHRVLQCVFKQAASPESKFWSDKLLHETLYLCAMMLSQECATDVNSLCNAAIGRCGSKWYCSDDVMVM